LPAVQLATTLRRR